MNRFLLACTLVLLEKLLVNLALGLLGGLGLSTLSDLPQPLMLFAHRRDAGTKFRNLAKR